VGPPSGNRLRMPVREWSVCTVALCVYDACSGLLLICWAWPCRLTMTLVSRWSRPSKSSSMIAAYSTTSQSTNITSPWRTTITTPMKSGTIYKARREVSFSFGLWYKIAMRQGRQRRGDGGCIPTFWQGGCNASHPPCCDELVSIITMSHSTECGLSFFLYEWWHLAVTYSTSHHCLEDRLLKLANTICYLNGPRALIVPIEKSLAAQFHSWLIRYLFYYYDRKKRSFQSKMHQKPSGEWAQPGPAGELKRSPRPPSRIRGLGPQEGRRREGMGREGRGRERMKGKWGGEGKERKEEFIPQWSLAVDATAMR